MEMWKAIAGFPLYEVSSEGRVRSIGAQVLSKNGAMRFAPPRMIRPSRKRTGYLEAKLFLDGERCFKLVHRLVLTAFVGPCPAGSEACHADGVRDNNRVENLRWDTRKGNHADRYGHGTIVRLFGAANPNSKLYRRAA